MEWLTAGWWSYPVLAVTIAGSAVLPPVPAQCAAWPRFVPAAPLNTKFAVHCAPSVKVWMPGRMAAGRRGRCCAR